MVQGTTGLVSPKLCGENSGSHLYINAGAGREEEAGLSATISQSATWRIKVTTTTHHHRRVALPPVLSLAFPAKLLNRQKYVGYRVLKQSLHSSHLPVKVGGIY